MTTLKKKKYAWNGDIFCQNFYGRSLWCQDFAVRFPPQASLQDLALYFTIQNCPNCIFEAYYQEKEKKRGW